VAALGHVAIHHVDPGPDAALQLSGAWRQDNAGWVGRSAGRFTLLFERFAVEVFLASASVSQACALLGIGWDTAQEIMRRAVERGLERRQLERLRYLGMDEKSFRHGQSYISC